MNRTDLQHLAEVRVEEARLLFNADKFDGAYYLAGYAVELALKACVAKLTGLHDFYDPAIAKRCFSHKPGELVAVANLLPQLQADMAADADLQANWVLACTWASTSRYEQHNRDEADALLRAITDPDHGVLQWIRTHW